MCHSAFSKCNRQASQMQKPLDGAQPREGRTSTAQRPDGPGIVSSHPNLASPQGTAACQQHRRAEGGEPQVHVYGPDDVASLGLRLSTLLCLALKSLDAAVDGLIVWEDAGSLWAQASLIWQSQQLGSKQEQEALLAALVSSNGAFKDALAETADQAWQAHKGAGTSSIGVATAGPATDCELPRRGTAVSVRLPTCGELTLTLYAVLLKNETGSLLPCVLINHQPLQQHANAPTQQGTRFQTALLAKTPAILTVCDTNGRVLYQNPAAVAYAGPRADASPTTTSASYLEELFALEPELLQEVRDAVCAAGAGDAEWCGEGVRVPRSLAVHLPCVKLNSLKVTTTGLWDSWLSSPAAAGSPAAIAAQLPAARTHAPPPAAVTADYSSTNIAADQQRDGAMLLSAELLITGDGGLLDEGVVISRLQQRRSTVVPASPPCSPAQQRSGPQAPQVSAVHWESMTCDLSCVQPRLVGRAAHVRSLELGSSCGHPSVQSSPGNGEFSAEVRAAGPCNMMDTWTGGEVLSAIPTLDSLCAASGSVDSRSFTEQRKARRASVTRFPSPFSPRVQSLLKVSRSSNSNVITGNGPPSPVSPAPRRQVSRWASSGGLDYPTQDSNASQDDSELSDLAGTESLNLKPAVSKVSILDTKSSTGSVLGVRTKQCSVGTEHQGGAEHGHSQTHSVAGPALSFKIVSSADELSGQMEATTQPVEEAAQDAGLPASLAAQAAGVPAPLSTQDHGSSVPALPRAALDTLLGTATSGLPPYRTTYDQLCGTLFSDAELLQANDGVSTAIRKLATDAGGAQRGGSEAQVLTRSGTDQAGDACWDEIKICRVDDPVTGGTYLVINQVDVTERMETEAGMAQISEASLALLEMMFPRHVIEHLTVARPGFNMLQSTASVEMNSGLDKLATKHDSVTLFFCDIVGFTTMSQELEPVQVMRFLNELYSKYDALADDWGVYKVETVGDCYVVAGGLMARDEEGFAIVTSGCDAPASMHHSVAVMRFAQEVLKAASCTLMPNSGKPVQIRIGLHSGPITSGIVGYRMPKFCLFGDSMNTCSRMETTAPYGCIHMSAATYQLLSDNGFPGLDELVCTGGVEVKGKGKMVTYVYKPPASEPAPQNAGPAGVHQRPNQRPTLPRALSLGRRPPKDGADSAAEPTQKNDEAVQGGAATRWAAERPSYTVHMRGAGKAPYSGHKARLQGAAARTSGEYQRCTLMDVVQGLRGAGSLTRAAAAAAAGHTAKQPADNNQPPDELPFNSIQRALQDVAVGRARISSKGRQSLDVGHIRALRGPISTSNGELTLPPLPRLSETPPSA